MYVKQTPRPFAVTKSVRFFVAFAMTGLLTDLCGTASAQPQVIRNITQPSQRLEMTVNTSQILTLDQRVPKMVVNNPELVSVTPISATQVQIAAKKPGVTQINLWDENDQVYTVDLMIYGDVRELDLALKRLFPESSVKVMRLTNSLVLEGFVERPEAVGPIVRLAEDYAPKIVNNITVGGVQQILLKVKVMEVSRTKLRKLGYDWSNVTGGNGVTSSISGLLSAGVNSTGTVINGGDGTITARVGSFSNIVDALQQNNIAKILADPTIVAVSGRPAHFNVGGEIPIIVPSGLGQSSIEYKPFGTQIDFLPIVLGNGNIRLECRPRVSEIDDSRSVTLNSFSVPGLRVRTVDTAVELKAGQTLALAGLVQSRVEAQERGLPFLSDLPFVGAAFRSVQEEVNEVELLILVTPEFVDGLDPHEVPQCGPGMESVSPSNCQLYWGGNLEVPSCNQCGPHGCGGADCGAANGSCQSNGSNYGSNVGSAYISDGASAAAINSGSMQYQQIPLQPQQNYQPNYMETQPGYQQAIPEPVQTPIPDTNLPPQTPPVIPQGEPQLGPEPSIEPTASGTRNPWSAQPSNVTTVKNPYSQGYPQAPATAQLRRPGTNTPGLMGPIGYDVEK